ncbi:MAG: ATP-binding protein [Eubacteriales bacterium]|nr:ATP-binding protein [Eubacteriales bacterium]
MRIHSIKFKITCWYTLILLAVFAVVLTAAFFYSEYYGENVIKEELREGSLDLQEKLEQFHGDYAEKSLTFYYDDGVMLSLYDEEGKFLAGILPDDSLPALGFSQKEFQKLQNESKNWFLRDEKISLSNGKSFWIRGVHSYSAVVVMTQKMVRILCILFPALVLFTAFVGYRMILNSLSPVQTITNAAKDITASSDLSLRIPLPKAKDEFYDLSLTFNEMFQRLEQSFLNERQFSSDAAHELRTPLSVLLSHCEYCLDELELSAEAAAEIRLIRQKAQRLSLLVSQLLSISREEQRRGDFELEEVDLALLAESTADELAEKAGEKKIRILVENRLEQPVISANFSMIARVFLNLTDNAITYGREGGYVRITLSAQDGQICLKFEDDGIGIPQESLDKIWNRFYRVDESRTQGEGFGLGLFLVKQIVEHHHGTAAVESIPGQGSTFTILLPNTAV